MAENQETENQKRLTDEDVKKYTRKDLERYLEEARVALETPDKSGAFEMIHNFALKDIKDFIDGKLEIDSHAFEMMDRFIETFASGYTDQNTLDLYNKSKEKLSEVSKNSDKDIKEKGEHLFKLLSKKELSDDEKKEIGKLATPEILQSKSFAGHFEVSDMFSAYQAGMDIHALIEKNAKGRDVLNTVLKNLKDIPLKNNVSAAKYMLDNALLPNGELIGTQFVKNVHFLGAAAQDSKDENLQGEELKKEVRKELDLTAGLYKSLYDKEGYNANPNRRNVLGQKVGDVMQTCIETPNKNVEDINRQVFAQSTQRKTMTLDQLREGQYRGTLTTEQAEQLKNAEKEADLANTNGDYNRYDKDKKGNKFKDEDIIKYMYEEWFLAGLGWLFDQAESGMEICLNKLLYEREPSEKKPPEKKQSDDAKKFLDKVNAFHQASTDAVNKIHSDYHGNNDNGRYVAGKNEKYAAFIKELSDFAQTLGKGKQPDAAKEDDLKSRYGESFIDQFKEDYLRHPQSVQRWMDKGASNMLLAMETSSILAQRLAQAEMTIEAMDKTKKWKKRGQFKDDATLDEERNQKAEKIQKELIDAAVVVAEEERIWAETYYKGLKTPEGKDQFIQNEVLSVSDAEQKKKLEHEYEVLKANGSEEQIQQWASETIAAQRVTGFFEKQREGYVEASRLIQQDLTQGCYQANGKDVKPNAAECLKNLQKQREKIQKDGSYDAKLEGGERLKATMEHVQGLLDAVKTDNLSGFYEQKRVAYDQAEQLLGERRAKNNKRLEVLKKFKKDLTIEKNSKYIDHNYNFKLQKTR